MKSNQRLGLGGGCHWCTEAVFKQINGVIDVRQGYIASLKPHDSMSEAILLEYDPNIIDLNLLIDIHLETHASTTSHSRRAEYRSAVYYLDEDLRDSVEIVMSTLSQKRNKSYITLLLPFVEFKESRESIQNYYETRPEAPFCKRYIEPKLEILNKLLEGTCDNDPSII